MPSQQANSIAYGLIPCAPEQGIFDQVSGKIFGGTGNFMLSYQYSGAIRLGTYTIRMDKSRLWLSSAPPRTQTL
jgi:hypothetical protein